MNHLGIEVLDHGDDPGRYTIIRSNGQVQTCNSNGSIICERRCKRPWSLVHDLCRERGIRPMPPSQVPAFLKKITEYGQDQKHNEFLRLPGL